MNRNVLKFLKKCFNDNCEWQLCLEFYVEKWTRINKWNFIFTEYDHTGKQMNLNRCYDDSIALGIE